MHHPWCYNEPIAHNAQHFLQSFFKKRIGPNAIEIGETPKQIRGSVCILETNRRTDAIQKTFIARQNRSAILLVEHEIPAVLVVVRMLLEPIKGRLRKLETLRIPR